MATSLKTAAGKKKASRPAAARAIYLYAISQLPSRVAATAAEGIDGSAPVEAVRCEGYLCWISRVSKDEFADRLTENMQNLEWLASAGLRHQRVVAEVSQNLDSLPARFGTVFLTEGSLAKHVSGRKHALREAFERVADADEWGIKIFETAKPKQTASLLAASSGSDYLKRKAEQLQPRAGLSLDEDVQLFIARLSELAVAASPGGKASAGQPGLLWHGSFLIRRKDRKKLESELKKFAAKWQHARSIDCSGPWPPYSFLEDHAD